MICSSADMETCKAQANKQKRHFGGTFGSLMGIHILERAYWINSCGHLERLAAFSEFAVIGRASLSLTGLLVF